MSIPTGNAWHVDDPDKPKPWAWFDPDAVRDIPCNWGDWLADVGDDIADHDIIADPNLECVVSDEENGIVIARIKKASAGVLSPGSKYGVTYRITTVDGEKEDQTLYLKIREK